MQTTRSQVVIIGGGIVGCAAAYYLARRGVSVILLEKSVIGAEGSGRNAGGVRQQCRDPRELDLSIASVRMWESLEQELGFDVEYNQGGSIRLAATEARLAELERQRQQEERVGLHVELWDRHGLQAHAPYLADRFIGAKYCATDGIANPILATKAYGWAAERAGARVFVGTEALEIRTAGGNVSSVVARNGDQSREIHASTVVNAAGPWAGRISRTVGVDLPLESVRVVLATTEPVPFLFREFISSHDVGVYARPARHGSIHVGGVGKVESTTAKSVPLWALQYLARVGRMIPLLTDVNLLRAWSGLLDMTPDGVPILGEVPGVGGYIVAAGFSGHGFCLGPIMGRLIAELITEGQPSLSLDALRLSRFNGRGA